MPLPHRRTPTSPRPSAAIPDLIVHRLVKTLLAEGAEPMGGPEETASSSAQRFAAAKSAEKGHSPTDFEAPYPREELVAIAQECSETERRAADAERELIEWKKIKFMQDRVGEDFDAMVLSVTKYGLFVELGDLYVEGLVPIFSMTDDHYTYREVSREICGQRGGRCYRPGMKVRVLLDRIDRANRRLQFAVLPDSTEREAGVSAGTRPFLSRTGKTAERRNKAAKKVTGTRAAKRGNVSHAASPAFASPDRSGKPKKKNRKAAGKNKGKRR